MFKSWDTIQIAMFPPAKVSVVITTASVLETTRTPSIIPPTLHVTITMTLILLPLILLVLLVVLLLALFFSLFWLLLSSTAKEKDKNKLKNFKMEIARGTATGKILSLMQIQAKHRAISLQGKFMRSLIACQLAHLLTKLKANILMKRAMGMRFSPTTNHSISIRSNKGL